MSPNAILVFAATVILVAPLEPEAVVAYLAKVFTPKNAICALSLEKVIAAGCTEFSSSKSNFKLNVKLTAPCGSVNKLALYIVLRTLGSFNGRYGDKYSADISDPSKLLPSSIW